MLESVAQIDGSTELQAVIDDGKKNFYIWQFYIGRIQNFEYFVMRTSRYHLFWGAVNCAEKKAFDQK